MIVGLIFDMYLGKTKIEQRGMKWDKKKKDGILDWCQGARVKILKSGEGR